MRIVTDKNRCVGAGQCVLTDPTIFDQDEYDGTVLTRLSEVDGERLAQAEQAAEICPSQAITLVPTED